MATSTSMCGICEHRNISKSSVSWCSECKQGFCSDCTKHHSIGKDTRNHNTKFISQNQKLPTKVLTISQFCIEHNEKYQIYCKKHDCVCCHRCVFETHNNCQEISALDDVIRDDKTSNALYEPKQTFTELLENIQRIRTHREENLKSRKELNISSTGRFGEVCVDIERTDVVPVQGRDNEAQIMVPEIPTRFIENMSLQLKRTIDTGLPIITSCLLLPAGKMAFAQFRECIAFFNGDGSKDFEVNTKDVSFDIAYIMTSNTLAVTNGYGLTSPISVIDINTRKICKKIPIDTKSDGIVVRNNTLLYCARKRGIRMINMDNDLVTDIVTGEQPSLAYLASFGDLLYYTNKDRNTVTCCDLKGNKRWEFKNGSLLQYPLGISTDHDGNVYVVGFFTHNVVVISPDGQQHRQLLSAKDGLNYPRGIHHDPSTNRLLVTNQRDKAFLYTVKFN